VTSSAPTTLSRKPPTGGLRPVIATTAGSDAASHMTHESSDMRRSIESQGLLSAAAQVASAPHTGVFALFRFSWSGSGINGPPYVV
jgi:hypothetical protein